MSELRTNRIVPRDGLPSGSSGGIIQVKSTTKTTHQSILESSGSSAYPSGAVDIMTVSITPTRADSKILVSSTVQAASTNAAILYMYRDSTVNNAGTDGSSNKNNVWSSLFPTFLPKKEASLTRCASPPLRELDDWPNFT